MTESGTKETVHVKRNYWMLGLGAGGGWFSFMLILQGLRVLIKSDIAMFSRIPPSQAVLMALVVSSILGGYIGAHCSPGRRRERALCALCATLIPLGVLFTLIYFNSPFVSGLPVFFAGISICLLGGLCGGFLPQVSRSIHFSRFQKLAREREDASGPTRYWPEALFFILLLALSSLSALAIYVTERKDLSYSLLSMEVVVCGVLAFLFQRFLAGRPLKEMGYAGSGCVVRGLALVLILFALLNAFAFGIPYALGLIAFSYNPRGLLLTEGPLPFLWTILSSFLPMGVLCLFGEEAAFRGYLLNSLLRKTTLFKAVVSNSVLFAVWHIPYWLVFRDVGDSPMVSLAIILPVQALSSAILALLFVVTKDLYSVSFYHVVADIVMYQLVTTVEAQNDILASNAAFLASVRVPWVMLAFNVLGMVVQIGILLHLLRHSTTKSTK